MSDGTATTTDLDVRLEKHRVELTGYCYRMLGSVVDADDAVQETMVRAWKNLEKFDGRASLHTWLYRIATNVCLDVLTPATPGASDGPDGPLGAADGGLKHPPGRTGWSRCPTRRVLPRSPTRPSRRCAQESVRLAFVAALQQLPPKQRAVLILREVLALEGRRGRRAARTPRWPRSTARSSGRARRLASRNRAEPPSR